MRLTVNMHGAQVALQCSLRETLESLQLIKLVKVALDHVVCSCVCLDSALPMLSAFFTTWRFGQALVE